MNSEPQLPDRYRVVTLLGEGGAGRVWLVEDMRQRGRRLALKELTDTDADHARRMRLEFATLSGLRHVNLVEVHEFDEGSEGGRPLFTLEYVDGDDLVTTVRREGLELWTRLAAEALRALAFLHDFGVVHRDLKPGNLLVRRRPRLDSRLVVLDFGLALHQASGGAEGRAPAGTLPYMAPELFDGSPPGPRSDLYALGAVLFEALHGHTPVRFDGTDAAGFVDRVRQGRRARPAPPAELGAAVGGWLDLLLAVDPLQRPGDAAEALAQLNAAADTSCSLDNSSERSARLGSGAPPGRDATIETLWQLLEPSERPRLIWLCGTPGSGRRRILRWFAGETVARGWRTLSAPAELDEEAGDAEGVERLLADLRGNAEQIPTLLLLPDVDEAGSRTVTLLERIAREGRAAPVRVLAALDPGAVRVPELRRLLAQTGKVPTLERVALPRLDDDGLRALIDRATAGGTVSAGKLRWLEEHSEGNAQTAEALIVDGAWERGGRGGTDGTLAASLERRIEELPADRLHTLEALAALGVGVPEGQVAEIAEIELEECREGLAELATLGLIRAEGSRWSVATRVLATRVVERMDTERRRRLARRAATFLEGLGDGVSTLPLARLWAVAGNGERVRHHAERVGDAAMLVQDPVVAARGYALALIHTGRRGARRFALRIKHGEALRAANVPRDAARAFGAARILASGDEERAESMSRQATMLVQAGRFDRARAVADAALDLARSRGFATIQARCKQVVGLALARGGQGMEALPWLQQSVAEFETVGDENAQAHALQILAICEANEGLPEARSHFEAAIELFESTAGRGGLMNRVGLAVMEQRAGHLERARRMLQKARAQAAEQHNLTLEGITAGSLAHNSMLQGRYGEVVALSREAEDQALYLGDDRLRFASRGARSLALAACGRVAEGIEGVQQLLDAPHDKVDPVYIEYIRLASIEARGRMPRPDEERLSADMSASLGAARRLGDPDNWLWALVLEMERGARTGDEPAHDLARTEFDDLFRKGGSWRQPHFAVRAELARTELSLTLERFEESARLAVETAALAEGLEMPVFSALATARLCESMVRQERHEDAAGVRRTGRRLLDVVRKRIGNDDLARGFGERSEFEALRSTSAGVDRRLLALYDMIRALNSEEDPEQLLRHILDMALEAVRAQRGMILLHDDEHDRFTVRCSRNLDPETVEDGALFSRHVVAAAGAGKSVLALDAQNDDRFREMRSVSLNRIRSLMCVPLRSRGKLTGVVYLDSRGEIALFDEQDLRFVEAFADHAALALENLRDRARLEEENRALQAAVEESVRFGNFIGRSQPMERVFHQIEKVASRDVSVLIQGESGTGKELVAKAIHFNGPRREQPFITENCAAMPDTLLQSELFGHTRGAFTGADRDRAGLFEQADGGTVMLDEVGDMSSAMQTQLLRVLQEGEVRRIGGDRAISVDVRVLAATHRDLEQEVVAGRFREDLLYRLQVMLIHLPPLRERNGDVELLIEHFLERISRARGRTRPAVTPEVLAKLRSYAWPGNVRQLENSLQRLALLAGDGPIDEVVLSADTGLSRLLRERDREPRAPRSMRRSEEERIREALSATEGHRVRAARMLGISRATLYRKIKDYGI